MHVSLISRYKISRIHPDPRKQRKLIPSKISRYTVYSSIHCAIMVCNCHMLDKGNVTRANVADVEINNSASGLIFRENVTVYTLWTGTFTSYKERNTMLIQWSFKLF